MHQLRKFLKHSNIVFFIYLGKVYILMIKTTDHFSKIMFFKRTVNNSNMPDNYFPFLIISFMHQLRTFLKHSNIVFFIYWGKVYSLMVKSTDQFSKKIIFRRAITILNCLINISNYHKVASCTNFVHFYYIVIFGFFYIKQKFMS